MLEYKLGKLHPGCYIGGAGDERVGRHSAGRAGRRAGLRTGWQAGPSVTHARASRRTGLRLSQMAGLSVACASEGVLD